MRVFGSPDDYSLGTIVGWLESQVESEADKPAGNEHVQARLDCAYDALAMLIRVDDWGPRDTKQWKAKKP
jgi:hypothetical protein